MLNINGIPAFNDNYVWMFYDEMARLAWVVDPGDAKPVIDTLKQFNLNLAGILITHHHRDHTGGIDDLLQTWPDAHVVGSHKSSIVSITHRVKEGDRLEAKPYVFQVMEIPGHTLDHIAFYNSDILFCGDTLFSFGCGKIFEGTPPQMFHSLEKLSQLSDTTKMYCGHEYTLANLNFAQAVTPNDSFLMETIESIKALKNREQCTLPSYLEIEKRLNPFLRCREDVIKDSVEKHVLKNLKNPVDVFAALREWKNHF